MPGPPTGLALGDPRTGRRYDPLRTFQFRVGFAAPPPVDPERPYVGGVQKVSGLSASIEATETWEGGNNLHPYANPNRVTWDPITLEQGVALDNQLEEWAAAVLEFVRTGRAPTQAVKRTLLIDWWDPIAVGGGTPAEDAASPAIPRVRRYIVTNAWIARYQALPALDATGSQIGLISVELRHEGWKLTPEVPSDLLPTS